MNKKLACSLFFVSSAILIVRPVIASVNMTAGASVVGTLAKPEGDPMPPPGGPHQHSAGPLVADGNPMPPPSGPHSGISLALTGDGNPIPPPSGPHASDGDPMPPPGGP